MNRLQSVEAKGLPCQASEMVLDSNTGSFTMVQSPLHGGTTDDKREKETRMHETILVADPNIQFLDHTRALLEHRNIHFIQAMDEQEARMRLEQNDIDMCLINVSLPSSGGPELARFIREELGQPIPIAWMIGQGDAMPDPEVLELAEGLLKRPLRPQEVFSCLHGLRMSRHLLAQNLQMAHQLENHDGSAPAAAPAPAEAAHSAPPKEESPDDTPLYPMSWFRKLAALEVKRAIRFHQPLSLLLMAYDMTDDYLQGCPPDQLEGLSRTLAEMVRQTIRDIDIPVQFSQDHILILLPNTGIEGAIQEATRIRQDLTQLLHHELVPQYGEIPTLSIGATTSSVQEAFKFTDLLRDATRALREVRAQGGDGVFYC